jgi:hypothetical protein
MNENKELYRKIEEFKKEILLQVRTIALEKVVDKEFHEFTNTDGKKITLKKHKKEK